MSKPTKGVNLLKFYQICMTNAIDPSVGTRQVSMSVLGFSVCPTAARKN